VKELDIREDVDLLALAAEESARCAESDVTGAPVIVRGDPTLLRRMIRNLIENAQQHGAPRSRCAFVERASGPSSR
jgi:signal transduction histidine kinase